MTYHVLPTSKKYELIQHYFYFVEFFGWTGIISIYNNSTKMTIIILIYDLILNILSPFSSNYSLVPSGFSQNPSFQTFFYSTFPLFLKMDLLLKHYIVCISILYFYAIQMNLQI